MIVNVNAVQKGLQDEWDRPKHVTASTQRCDTPVRTQQYVILVAVPASTDLLPSPPIKLISYGSRLSNRSALLTSYNADSLPKVPFRTHQTENIWLTRMRIEYEAMSVRPVRTYVATHATIGQSNSTECHGAFIR